MRSYSLTKVPHFIKRLPVYWNMFSSDRVRWKLGLPHDSICINDDVQFLPGRDSQAFAIFQSMAFERRGRSELNDFLKLAEGCSSFLDLGASGGFFSAVFAVSRIGPTTVISVEPDPIAFAALTSAANRNARAGLEWQVANVGVGASEGTIPVTTEGYGFSIMPNYPTPRAMTVYPLAQICGNHRPDLIKIDIESMEHEVVTSNIDFLSDLKARIHLELHSPLIASRGLDPLDVIGALLESGYRQRGTKGGSKPDLLRLCPTHEIIHLELEHAQGRG
jgi:FkbM family methyltransferase